MSTDTDREMQTAIAAARTLLADRHDDYIDEPLRVMARCFLALADREAVAARPVPGGEPRDRTKTPRLYSIGGFCYAAMATHPRETFEEAIHAHIDEVLATFGPGRIATLEAENARLTTERDDLASQLALEREARKAAKRIAEEALSEVRACRSAVDRARDVADKEREESTAHLITIVQLRGELAVAERRWTNSLTVDGHAYRRAIDECEVVGEAMRRAEAERDAALAEAARMKAAMEYAHKRANEADNAALQAGSREATALAEAAASKRSRDEARQDAAMQRALGVDCGGAVDREQLHFAAATLYGTNEADRLFPAGAAPAPSVPTPDERPAMPEGWTAFANPSFHGAFCSEPWQQIDVIGDDVSVHKGLQRFPLAVMLALAAGPSVVAKDGEG